MIPLIPSKSRGGREKGWGVHGHSALSDWGPHSLTSFFHVKYNDCHEREPHLYSNAQYRIGAANRNNLELCLLTFPLNYMKKVNFEQTAAWLKKKWKWVTHMRSYYTDRNTLSTLLLRWESDCNSALPSRWTSSISSLMTAKCTAGWYMMQLGLEKKSDWTRKKPPQRFKPIYQCLSTFCNFNELLIWGHVQMCSWN